MRLLVLVLALLALALAQGTPSALDTPVFINLDPVATNESFAPSTLRGVLWGAQALLAWTDTNSGAFLHSVPYAALTQANATFATSAQSFRAQSDLTVQAGVLTGSGAYLWGISVLYRVPDVANVSNVQASVVFPVPMLSRTGFELGSSVYSPQWSAVGTVPPQLYATDEALYLSGYAGSTSMVGNLSFPEMITSVVDNGFVYAGYTGGEIEVRSASNVAQVLATVTIGNITGGGFGLLITEIVVDDTNKLLYVAGSQETRGWVCRLNISDLAAIDDRTFTVYDDTNSTGTLPLSSSNPLLWRALLLGTTVGSVASNIVVDTIVGVGYASLNEQVSRVSYLLKFDAVNMKSLGAEVTTLYREDTIVVGLHMRNGDLIMATETSVALIAAYPTSCSNDCNALLGRGRCERSVCNCTSDWTGLACDEEACKSGCGEALGRGTCRKGRCVCTANFTGPTCSERRCENDCSGHGTCDTATFQCDCDAKYKGNACELERFNSCEGLNDDKDAINLCIQFASCGWCFDEGVCKEGTRAGPSKGSCRQWLVDSTYDIITVVFGAIIIFCFLVMFIINVISALMEDWKLATIMSNEGSEGDSMLARTQWWRDERSAKSWKLWDQLQFISYFSIINAVFSTRLVQFTGYFNWANFSLPGIFVDKTIKPERASAFVTASIEQYSNAHGMTTKMTYFNALIWWLIATAVFLVLYLAYYVIVVFIMRKGGRFKEILLHRVFHILTRALLAGYLPLVLLAALYISNWQDGLMAVPIIFGLAIAIGAPVLNFLVVKGEKTDFLYYSLRIRFGAFYVSYQHTRTKFAFIVFGRKFLVAALVGFLATKTIDAKQEVLFWVQSLVPAGLMLVYIVLLVVFNPYIDLVHTILDIILNLINIITLATGYLHRSNSVDDKVAGVFVAMILQIAGLVFVIFAYLWTWLFYAGYTSPGQLCSGKPDPDAEDGKKKDGGKAAPAKGDDAGKKKDDVKGVNEANLKDLEISESDS